MHHLLGLSATGVKTSWWDARVDSELWASSYEALWEGTFGSGSVWFNNGGSGLIWPCRAGWLWTWRLIGSRCSLKTRWRPRWCVGQCALVIRLGGSDFSRRHLLEGAPSGSRSWCRGPGARGHLFWILLITQQTYQPSGRIHSLGPPPRIDDAQF